MAEPSKAVLITGCSSGIGRATAQRLLGSGWTVYATARKPEALADLAAEGARTLALDVTDEASMRAAVERVEQDDRAVGVLINNAGYSQSGAIETVPMDAARRQFETNVFGVVRLTQRQPYFSMFSRGRAVSSSSLGTGRRASMDVMGIAPRCGWAVARVRARPEGRACAPPAL